MIKIEPVTLESNGVRLEPMTAAHADGLKQAAADGELWRIRVTSVPAPPTSWLGSQIKSGSVLTPGRME